MILSILRISGTGHCGGGDGAWRIGQAADLDVGMGAEENVLTALVKWAEEGGA